MNIGTIGNILDRIYEESNYQTRLRVGNKNTNDSDGIYLGHKCILRYRSAYSSVVPNKNFYSDIMTILKKHVIKTHVYITSLTEE